LAEQLVRLNSGVTYTNVAPEVRREKQATLFFAWLRECQREECPKCNSVDVELTEQPVAIPGSDRVIRVCGPCLAEIKRTGGRPVYTRK
jgi:hypothetical protein